MSTAICPWKNVITKVRITPTIENNHTEEPIVEATCRLSFAPVAMAINTVVPVVIPRMIPVIVCIT